MMEFREGKAVINVPTFEKVTSKSPVFYNPAMAFDRELSRAVVKASKKQCILDAFSGSGIRAILYALEGASVTANDINKSAVDVIKKNAALNQVSLRVLQEDVNILLRRESFEIIDVDPFGSPAPYLDSVMHGLQRDSLLFVTATDTKALCGYAKRAALRKYGIKTVRTPFGKELGVRVLLTTIMREGAKYGFGFSVLLSYWRKHYIRVFLKVSWSKKAAFKTMDLVQPVYCCRCGVFLWEPTQKCPSCKKSMDFIFPVYLGKIKENAFLEKLEAPLASTLCQELDIPFYYDTHYLAKYHRFQPPKIDELIKTLKKSDFAASRTIFSSTSVKTDAPFDTVITAITSL